jgi:hypothetical protein
MSSLTKIVRPLSNHRLGLDYGEIAVGALLSLLYAYRAYKDPRNGSGSRDFCDVAVWAGNQLTDLVHHLEDEFGSATVPAPLGLPAWICAAGSNDFYDLLDELDTLSDQVTDDANEVHMLKRAFDEIFAFLDGPAKNAKPRIPYEKVPQPGDRMAARNASYDDAPSEPYAQVDGNRRTSLPIPISQGNGSEYALLCVDLDLEDRASSVGYAPAIDPRILKGAAVNGFDSALDLARRAVLNLLPESATSSLRNAKPQLLLRNVVPPFVAEGDSNGLPVALELLRRCLDLPRPNCVASGVLRPQANGMGDFTVEPLAIGSREGKALAVAEDGGWRRLVGVGDTSVRTDTMHLIGADEYPNRRVTLAHVAMYIWGDRFLDALKTAMLRPLSEVGIVEGWRSQEFPLARVVKLPRVSEWANTLKNSQPCCWGISGPNGTGKTMLAQDLVHQLEFRGYRPLVMRFEKHTLWFDGFGRHLGALMQLARQISDLENRSPVLIMDDLHFAEKIKDYRRIADEAASRNKVPVVFIRSSHFGDNWDPLPTEWPSLYSEADRKGFASALLDQYGVGLANGEWLRKAVEEDRLPNTLYAIVEYADNKPTLARIRALCRDEKTLVRLRKLAYASAYGIGVDSGFRSHFDQDAQVALQLMHPREFPERFVIGARPLVFAILSEDFNDDTQTLFQIRDWFSQDIGCLEIADILRDVIERGEAEDAFPILEFMNRRWKTSLRRLLGTYRGEQGFEKPLLSMDRVEKAFDESFSGDAGSTARLILACGSGMMRGMRLTLIRKMVEQLREAVESWNVSAKTIDPTDLRSCLQVVDDYPPYFLSNVAMYRDTLDKDANEILRRITADDTVELFEKLSRIEEETRAARLRARIAKDQGKIAQDWAAILQKLPRTGMISELVSRISDVSERLSLLFDIVQLQLDDLTEEAAYAALRIFDGVNFRNDERFPPADQYPFFIKALDCTERMGRAMRAGGGRGVDLSAVVEAGNFLRSKARQCAQLANRDRNFSDIRSFAQWVALMLRLDEFDVRDDFEGLAKVFSQYTAASTNRELIDALAIIGNQNRSAAIQLLVNANNLVRVNLLDRDRGTLGDFVDLLGFLNGTKMDIVRNLMWTLSVQSSVNYGMSRRLADWALESNDLVHAGRLIRIAASIDETIAPSLDKGFAWAFFEAFAADRDRFLETVRNEARTAPIFFLVEGLSEIGHPILDDVCDLVVVHIRNRIRARIFNPWAARLALLMVETDSHSKKFRAAIIADDGVPRADVLEGMVNADSVDALTAFHQLSRIYPDIAQDFGQKAPPTTMAEYLRENVRADGRVDLLLEAAQVISDTYRRIPEQGWKLARTFRAALRFHDITNAFREVRAENAHAALARLYQFDAQTAEYFLKKKQALEIASDKLIRNRNNPEQVAEFLETSHRILPGYGRTVLGNTPVLRKILDARVRYIQNPRSYARTARFLNGSGVDIAHGHVRNFDSVWASHLDKVTSPAVVLELILMFESMRSDQGSHRASQLPTQVSMKRVARRISFGRQADLDYTPSLLLALQREGADDAVALVIEALKRVGPDKLAQSLSLSQVNTLLYTLWSVDTDAVSWFVGAAEDRLIREALVPTPQDDEALWLLLASFGLFARCALNKIWCPFEDVPESLAVAKDPGALLFISYAMGGSKWAPNMMRQALKDIEEKPNRVPRPLRHVVRMILEKGKVSALLAHRIGDRGATQRLQFGPFSETVAHEIVDLIKSLPSHPSLDE